MKKRVFIIHGWDGSPKESWLPWLKDELEKRNFEVIVPSMPDSENPKIEEWVETLSKLVGETDENTFFVGYSIGGQTVLRYLQNINEKVGGVILVAGWVHLTNLLDDEVEIAIPWVKTPINWERIKNKTDNFMAIFSDNDQYVPLSDSEIFKEKLGAKIIIEKGKGHFTEDDNVYEIPVALKELLRITEKV